MPLSPKRVGSVAYAAAMFLVVSVLSGVLIAGLFVPFAGVAGASSKAAMTEFDKIPAELSTPAPATRSKVLDANGKVLAYFYDENRIPVKLNKIAPIMRQAQLAIEDHRFYEHGALDLKGTLRALVRNSAGGSTQGGSSITQQYVKMVQVEACQMKGDDACVKAVQAPTVERKIRELRYAIALEKRFSKDQILERYLNIAYYGEGAYGIQAAAKHFYNTDASKLTLSQAAMLAGLVQNPDKNNPVRNLSAALDRRDVVLNRMGELGIISLAQMKAAKKAKFDVSKVKRTRNGCVGTDYPFLCDYVRGTLLSSPSLGKNVDERTDLLNRGGLTIQTAIEPKTQDIAQKAVNRVIGPTDPVISTMTMMQPGTGLIIAMAQSRPAMGSDKKKGQTWYNYSVQQGPLLHGAEGYQAGSTFKPFTAAAALEKGVPLNKKYNASSPLDFSHRTFSTCLGSYAPKGYRAKNSTGSGVMDMRKAMARSVNTYFLQLEETIGVCPTTKMAKRLGIELSNGKNMLTDPETQVASFTLGVSYVTPLSMAEAYATLAARGVHCDPVIVSKITTRDGKELDPPDAKCKRVMEPEIADAVTSLLTGVMRPGGTGLGVRIPGIVNQAGKTGTTSSTRSVWFAGFTPEIAGISMIAVDTARQPWKKHTGRGLDYYVVPSKGIRLDGHGSTDAGQKIWKPAMTAAMKGKPDVAFVKPPDVLVRGKNVTVPSLYGLSYASAKAKLVKAGFTVLSQAVYSDIYPRGSFLGFSPGSGAVVPQFSTIYALTSLGRDPAKVAAERAAEQRAREEARRRAEEEQKKRELEERAKENEKNKPGDPKPGG